MMYARAHSLMLVPVLLLAAALALTGCGGSSSETSGGGSAKVTASDAKDAFVASCGGCHTLKAAGTSGAAGPNLDELAPDEQTVRTQIKNGGGAMPAGLLKGADADAVAKYVAENAGK